MADLFRSGSVSQFIIHGNVFDLVPYAGVVNGKDPQAAAGAKDAAAKPKDADPATADTAPAGQAISWTVTPEKNGKMHLLPLKQFLNEVMFASYDVVLHYDRGHGILAVKGMNDWVDWLQQVLGNDWVKLGSTREGGKALELIDNYLLRCLNARSLNDKAPRQRIAVIIDFSEFVVPRGEAIQMSGDFASNIVKVLGWANYPAILQSNIATVLLTEGLHDLDELVVENPHASKLKIPLPDEAAMSEYLEALQATQFPQLMEKCELPADQLAKRLTGLSRVGARTVIGLALNNNRTLSADYLAKVKKDMIERDCGDLLEFMESPYTLDNLAGQDAAKAWLREDTILLRRQAVHALPMGYLITGRIGTGKTFMVQCWAGELGVPCVVFKNFRDKWVGATESNLEKIFSILRAIGQVIVFVDEADQAAGKRGGGDTDGGLSGRVYGMLAAEMSDTRNRGKVVWVFATSRPDLLEVDLKRQGRLDVHIPLFGPQTPAEMGALMLSVARKLKFPLKDEDLPPLPPQITLGGHEVEGVLVRALRQFELSPEPRKPLKEILASVLVEVRPSAHTRKLEYMDLQAVKECTDDRFLPPQFKTMTPEQIESRLDELRAFV